MTPASQRALVGLRDLSTMKWYAISLLAFVFYVYVREIKAARKTGSWDAVLAGATLFGMDFVNETANGWILCLTKRSALWTVPGDTALRTMVGWNLEIMFMFAVSGLVFFHSWADDPRARVLGLPNRWFWAVVYSAICVVVELVLSRGGLLVWEYSFWNGTAAGVWLIFLFGYFHFYAAVILVLRLGSTRRRLFAVGGIYGVATLGNVIGLGILGWTY